MTHLLPKLQQAATQRSKEWKLSGTRARVLMRLVKAAYKAGQATGVEEYIETQASISKNVQEKALEEAKVHRKLAEEYLEDPK